MADILFILPIYNEEAQLEQSVERLRSAIAGFSVDDRYRIVIADNASTDRSAAIAGELNARYPEVKHLRIAAKGKGRALRQAWTDEQYDYSLYMDLDLSTDLKHVPAMIAAVKGGADLAIGSRLSAGSIVRGRSLKREITSRGYSFLVRLFLGSKLRDFQCGFKAISKQAALRYLPATQDISWFFDTELVVTVERSGGRVYEEPVLWVDDPGTTVNVITTAIDDIKGLLRLRREQPWNQV